MQVNTLIIGAGAAGMMCAAHAGRDVMIVDHAKAAGEKIRISGGGRCNFTNMYAAPENFLSQNPHFCKSALARYTQWDFVDLVAKAGIPYHEKTLGQLFCDTSAKDIIRLLTSEMRGADLRLNTSVEQINKTPQGFDIALQSDGKIQSVHARNLVIASGGKSIPKMGATGFGYQVAQQFGLAVTQTRAGLVPLTFGADVMEALKPMAGLSVNARVSSNGTGFEEGLLITHRGLSGPSILQVSSYWQERDEIMLHFEPSTDIIAALKTQRSKAGRMALTTALGAHLPARLAAYLTEIAGLSGNLADQSDMDLSKLEMVLTQLTLKPSGSEGYRTAEVTLGGVDTSDLDARTLQAKGVDGLYFIGEVVDVTGWLGGYNFQWAWSSGWAAGQAIAGRV
ncbi:NAD(P)/FAD-dependent oxidoreductase [Nereida sp. MMG025]|uniref:NAD(P)/FAD-dependent oxidoreductase n=1 Tax=Nereida sp. MMG025 TaxID=2909981 RepID=UPI001F3AE056|nr:NAD(P)/FAD-dependent oxidoreductase [Nereida sp. MMG025]MCF6445229.1 NAD(P)/FAD-dependent oxidoreductase [Nereida sp. MMG025]